MDLEMSVIKRNGEKEVISFDKILKRVTNLGKDELKINYTTLAMKIIDRLYHEIPTTEIDELTAQQCASLATEHPDYDILASRVLISNHQKSTPSTFTQVIDNLYNYKDIHNKHTPLVSKKIYEIVCKNSNEIESFFDYERDFLIDYFGFKTLERAYLMKINGVIVERPQHMWMRVAIGIHGSNLEKVKMTYELMSNKYFTHATPTLFNAGTPRPQCSSCYLIAMADDSIEGIYSTLMDCAQISKWAGGIGMHIHNIRGRGSHIRGTNGNSNGIVPMLRVYNNTARYVDQGGGRRHGSFAVYLEPWHTDIEDFLEMKKNHGDEEARARDLFYALWIPDLFMKRVESDTEWTLMCPDHCPGLADCYGDEFESLYKQYESEGRGTKKISARALWFKILDSQIETGTPYMLYKDACNRKSNQKNLGTIKSSNLCTEIIEYSNKDETAVCNLASLGLPMFVRADKTFNYEKLHEVTKIVTENLDKVIDINFYPTEKTKRSNYLHRPIGIGVQGLADVFAKMDIAFHSDEAKLVNIKIFETLYHASVEKSCELSQLRSEAIKRLVTTYNKMWRFLDDNPSCRQYVMEEGLRGVDGYDSMEQDLVKYSPILNEIKQCRDSLHMFPNCAGAYSSFAESPASRGILQFDLWGVEPNSRYNWGELKQKIKMYGMRNSLLMAPMPTASTSQIMGYNECFEPYTSFLYTRSTLAGQFEVVNHKLLRDLIGLGLWNKEMKNKMLLDDGSIQNIPEIPDRIKAIYKNSWDLSNKTLIDMSADRGAYVCQSQSLNLSIAEPTFKSLSSMHFYSWKKGLKTGIYYLRTKPKTTAQKFTVEPEKKAPQENALPCDSCSG